jgi:hypothetical protein
LAAGLLRFFWLLAAALAALASSRSLALAACKLQMVQKTDEHEQLYEQRRLQRKLPTLQHGRIDDSEQTTSVCFSRRLISTLLLSLGCAVGNNSMKQGKVQSNNQMMQQHIARHTAGTYILQWPDRTPAVTPQQLATAALSISAENKHKPKHHSLGQRPDSTATVSSHITAAGSLISNAEHTKNTKAVCAAPLPPPLLSSPPPWPLPWPLSLSPWPPSPPPFPSPWLPGGVGKGARHLHQHALQDSLQEGYWQQRHNVTAAL